MNAREWQIELERRNLSEFAAQSGASKGRVRPIAACELRTDFQRDRDRIIHCKSFRRLKHKTQVFLLPDGDHYRTRLTHTLEVSQIARTIARALRLNEDLTEAIALGHDLGHTPFGHVGESVLDALLPGGFQHNVQSLRVVETLEREGAGLNLCHEVRDGILHHKRNGTPETREGMVVSYADRIAYLNHDIDDAVRAGVLVETDLPAACVRVLGTSHGQRIDTMIRDIVSNSLQRPTVSMTQPCETAMHTLRDFMFTHVYTDRVAKGEEGKAMHVIEALLQHFIANPEQMPEEFRRRVPSEGVETAAADHIACMSDRYAVREYERIFVPQSWGL